jgi:hypothetical protein
VSFTVTQKAQDLPSLQENCLIIQGIQNSRAALKSMIGHVTTREIVRIKLKKLLKANRQPRYLN